MGVSDLQEDDHGQEAVCPQEAQRAGTKRRLEESLPDEPRAKTTGKSEN